MANRLLEPLLENGIHNTHFFNGRILTAEDLKTDQEAHRYRAEQLGRALGEGIACGLEVTLQPDRASVKITPGLALNRLGQVLELRLDERLRDCGAPKPVLDSLILELAEQPIEAAFDEDAGLFGICAPPKTETPALVGVFVLVLSPVSGFRGHAPRKSLSATGQNAGCGSRYAVEGVTFRLVGFPPHPELDLANPRLQNLLAHLCFGTEEKEKAHPFTPLTHYGALDALRASAQLSDCDVPLALLRWKDGKVEVCDSWAVRRPLTPHGGRRRAEALAMHFQFQEQIATFSASGLPTLLLQDHFRYLPPAGYLMLEGSEPYTAFDIFDKKQHFTLEPSELRLLLERALWREPIDLEHTRPELSLYRLNSQKGVLFLRADHSQPQATLPRVGTVRGEVDVLLEVGRAHLDALLDLEVEVQGDDGKKHSAQVGKPVFDSKGIQEIRQKTISMTFQCEGLPVGSYNVVATARSLSAHRNKVEVEANQVTELSLRLTELPVL